jgi:hypothetical protein
LELFVFSRSLPAARRMRLLTHLLHQPQPSWHQAHRLQVAAPQHQAVLSQVAQVVLPVQSLQRAVPRVQAAQLLLPLVLVVPAAVSDTQINLA